MAIRLSTNVPLSLTFPFGDSKEVQGEYGIQHLYTVEHNGQRDRLYATPVLHLKLQAAGLGPGQVATITKATGEGNRIEWRVEVQPKEYAPQFGPDHGNGQGQPAHQAPAAAPQETAANGTPHPASGARPSASAANTRKPAAPGPAAGNRRPAQAPPTPVSPPSPDFAALTQGMQYCLATAFEVWEGLPVDIPFTAEDVRTVGITLFLECSRRGVVPQAVEEGLPF